MSDLCAKLYAGKWSKGDLSLDTSPIVLEGLDAADVKQLVVGREHLAVLSSEGRVLRAPLTAATRHDVRSCHELDFVRAAATSSAFASAHVSLANTSAKEAYAWCIEADHVEFLTVSQPVGVLQCKSQIDIACDVLKGPLSEAHTGARAVCYSPTCRGQRCYSPSCGKVSSSPSSGVPPAHTANPDVAGGSSPSPALGPTPPSSLRVRLVRLDAEETSRLAAPSTSAGPSVKGFRVGNRLEAIDRQNRSLLCVATISKIELKPDGTPLLTIHFDGWGEQYDYKATPDDPDLHPVGWGSLTFWNPPLQQPRGHVGSFSWATYLEDVKAEAVNPNLLTNENNLLMHDPSNAPPQDDTSKSGDDSSTPVESAAKAPPSIQSFWETVDSKRVSTVTLKCSLQPSVRRAMGRYVVLRPLTLRPAPSASSAALEATIPEGDIVCVGARKGQWFQLAAHLSPVPADEPLPWFEGVVNGKGPAIRALANEALEIICRDVVVSSGAAPASKQKAKAIAFKALFDAHPPFLSALVLTQVHPSLVMSSPCKKLLEDLLQAVLDFFVEEAVKEAMASNPAQPLITQAIVQKRISDLYYGEVGKHGLSECVKATSKVVSEVFPRCLSDLSEFERITPTSGLVFPVRMISMQFLQYASMETGAGVGASAALEYLCAELVELGGNVSRANYRDVVYQSDIALAIENDEELKMTFERLKQHPVYQALQEARESSEDGVVPGGTDLSPSEYKDRDLEQDREALANYAYLEGDGLGPDAKDIAQDRGSSSSSSSSSNGTASASGTQAISPADPQKPVFSTEIVSALVTLYTLVQKVAHGLEPLLSPSASSSSSSPSTVDKGAGELKDAIEAITPLLDDIAALWELDAGKELVAFCPKPGAAAADGMLYIPSWVQNPMADAVTAFLQSLTDALDPAKVGESLMDKISTVVSTCTEQALGSKQSIVVFAEKINTLWTAKFMTHSALITNALSDFVKLCHTFEKYVSFSLRRKQAAERAERTSRQTRAAFLQDSEGTLTRNDRRVGFSVEGFAVLTEQLLPSEDWLAAVRKSTVAASRDHAGDAILRTAAAAFVDAQRKRAEKSPGAVSAAAEGTANSARTSDLNLTAFETDEARWQSGLKIGSLETVSGDTTFVSIHAMYSSLLAVSSGGVVYELPWSAPASEGLQVMTRRLGPPEPITDVTLLSASLLRATAVCRGSKCETWIDRSLESAFETAGPELKEVFSQLHLSADSDAFKVLVEGTSSSSAAPAGSQASSEAAPLPDQPAGTWSCVACTFFNEADAAQCSVCTTPRPESAVVAPAAAAPVAAAAAAPVASPAQAQAEAQAVGPLSATLENNIFGDDPIIDVAVSNLATVVLCQSGHAYWWGISPIARTAAQISQETPYEVGTPMMDKSKLEFRASIGLRVGENGSPLVGTIISKPADDQFAVVAVCRGDTLEGTASSQSQSHGVAFSIPAAALSKAGAEGPVSLDQASKQQTPIQNLPCVVPDLYARADGLDCDNTEHWHVGELSLVYQPAKSVLVLTDDALALIFDREASTAEGESPIGLEEVVSLFRGFRVKEFAKGLKIPLGASAFPMESHMLIPPFPNELIGQDFVVNGIDGVDVRSAPSSSSSSLGVKPIGRRIRVIGVEGSFYKIAPDWQMIPHGQAGYVAKDLVRAVCLTGKDFSLRETKASHFNAELLAKILPHCRVVSLDSIRQLPTRVFREPQLCVRPMPGRVAKKLVVNDREVLVINHDGSSLHAVPVFGTTTASFKSEPSDKVHVVSHASNNGLVRIIGDSEGFVQPIFSSYLPDVPAAAAAASAASTSTFSFKTIPAPARRRFDNVPPVANLSLLPQRGDDGGVLGIFQLHLPPDLCNAASAGDAGRCTSLLSQALVRQGRKGVRRLLEQHMGGGQNVFHCAAGAAKPALVERNCVSALLAASRLTASYELFGQVKMGPVLCPLVLTLTHSLLAAQSHSGATPMATALKNSHVSALVSLLETMQDFSLMTRFVLATAAESSSEETVVTVDLSQLLLVSVSVGSRPALLVALCGRTQEAVSEAPLCAGDDIVSVDGVSVLQGDAVNPDLAASLLDTSCKRVSTLVVRRATSETRRVLLESLGEIVADAAKKKKATIEMPPLPPAGVLEEFNTWRVVYTGLLNVRVTPSLQSDVVRSLSHQDRFDVIDRGLNGDGVLRLRIKEKGWTSVSSDNYTRDAGLGGIGELFSERIVPWTETRDFSGTWLVFWSPKEKITSEALADMSLTHVLTLNADATNYYRGTLEPFIDENGIAKSNISYSVKGRPEGDMIFLQTENASSGSGERFLWAKLRGDGLENGQWIRVGDISTRGSFRALREVTSLSGMNVLSHPALARSVFTMKESSAASFVSAESTSEARRTGEVTLPSSEVVEEGRALLQKVVDFFPAPVSHVLESNPLFVFVSSWLSDDPIPPCALAELFARDKRTVLHLVRSWVGLSEGEQRASDDSSDSVSQDTVLLLDSFAHGLFLKCFWLLPSFCRTLEAVDAEYDGDGVSPLVRFLRSAVRLFVLFCANGDMRAMNVVYPSDEMVEMVQRRVYTSFAYVWRCFPTATSAQALEAALAIGAPMVSGTCNPNVSAILTQKNANVAPSYWTTALVPKRLPPAPGDKKSTQHAQEWAYLKSNQSALSTIPVVMQRLAGTFRRIMCMLVDLLVTPPQAPSTTGLTNPGIGSSGLERAVDVMSGHEVIVAHKHAAPSSLSSFDGLSFLHEMLERLEGIGSWLSRSLDSVEIALRHGATFGSPATATPAYGSTNTSASSLPEYLLSLMRLHTHEHGALRPALDLTEFKHLAHVLDAFMYTLEKMTAVRERSAVASGEGGRLKADQSSQQFFYRSDSIRPTGDKAAPDFRTPLKAALPIAERPAILTPNRIDEMLVPSMSPSVARRSAASLGSQPADALMRSVSSVESPSPFGVDYATTVGMLLRRWPHTVRTMAAAMMWMLRVEGSTAIGSLATFSQKQAEFEKELTQFSARSHHFHVARDKVITSLEAIMQSLSSATTISAEFSGEAGGGDGVTRGWFEAFSTSLTTREKTAAEKEFFAKFSNVVPLFYEPGHVGFFSPTYHEAWSDPSDSVERQSLERLFVGIGKFVGLALFNRQVIPLSFNRHVIKILLGRRLYWHDLAFMDPMSFESMRKILVMAEEELEGKLVESKVADLMLTFSYQACADEGGELVELLPGGSEIEVTASNAKEYVHLYAISRLRCALPAALAMRKGLLSILPASILNLLNAEDLWLLLNGAGAGTIETARLKEMVQFRDKRPASAATARPLEEFQTMFWDVFESLTSEEKGRFLYFWTGWSRLPATQSPNAAALRINLQDASENLPRSQSCFKDMTIPNYPTKETLKEKILWAIQTDEYELT